MGFRTLEISKPAEIHIKNGQLEVETEEGILYIQIEDLLQIMVHGANIRLSTMEKDYFGFVRRKIATASDPAC